MTKPEILEVVKEMHRDWVNSYELDFDIFCIKTNTSQGFCNWLSLNVNYFNKCSCVMSELIKDRKKNSLIIYTGFWYNTLSFPQKNEVREALKPRIDHLQRTITRLENEIKSEN